MTDVQCDTCPCGAELQHPITGRKRRHCSQACRQRAYERRKRELTTPRPYPPAPLDTPYYFRDADNELHASPSGLGRARCGASPEDPGTVGAPSTWKRPCSGCFYLHIDDAGHTEYQLKSEDIALATSPMVFADGSVQPLDVGGA